VNSHFFLIELLLRKCANLPRLALPIVGLDEKVDNIKRKLQNNSLHVLGVVGMGGIGKTTLVKKLYHQIHNEFQKLSFLENVRSITPNKVQYDSSPK
jgi:translation initiation factor RLI1